MDKIDKWKLPSTVVLSTKGGPVVPWAQKKEKSVLGFKTRWLDMIAYALMAVVLGIAAFINLGVVGGVAIFAAVVLRIGYLVACGEEDLFRGMAREAFGVSLAALFLMYTSGMNDTIQIQFMVLVVLAAMSFVSSAGLAREEKEASEKLEAEKKAEREKREADKKDREEARKKRAERDLKAAAVRAANKNIADGRDVS